MDDLCGRKALTHHPHTMIKEQIARRALVAITFPLALSVYENARVPLLLSSVITTAQFIGYSIFAFGK